MRYPVIRDVCRDVTRDAVRPVFGLDQGLSYTLINLLTAGTYTGGAMAVPDYSGTLVSVPADVRAVQGGTWQGTIATGASLGSEQVTNGSFDVDTDWVKGSGWTISGGKANASNASTALYQANVANTGQRSYITITITDYISGSVRPSILGNADGWITSNGTYQIELPAINTDTYLYITGINFTGSVSIVSVKEVIPSFTTPVLSTGGYVSKPAMTNLLTNPFSPATQTTASLATGTYTASCYGSGSFTVAGNTATITGGGSVVQGTPVTFTVDVAGTVDATVTGSLDAFQIVNLSYAPPIVDGASTATSLQVPTPTDWTADSIYGEITVNPIQDAPVTKYILESTETDSVNQLLIYSSGTGLTLYRRVGGTGVVLSYATTITAGTPITIRFFHDTDIAYTNGLGIQVVGNSWYMSTDHTAAVIGTTVGVGLRQSTANSQFPGYYSNFKIYKNRAAAEKVWGAIA